jgi:hypothetical protein
MPSECASIGHSPGPTDHLKRRDGAWLYELWGRVQSTAGVAWPVLPKLSSRRSMCVDTDPQRRRANAKEAVRGRTIHPS